MLAEVSPQAPNGYRVTTVARDGERVVIYAAVRTSDNARVLLKTPRNERPTTRDVARLAHELAVLKRLAGAPVAMALAMEDTGGRPWLILENPAGESLNRIAARFRAPARAVALCAKIASALAEVHRRGVIHRDLKPNNVIILDDESVRLTDFRSASLLRVDSSVTTMEGTLAYMAPEQTGRMNRPVDKRADLYALGVTLYELLTGRLPFEANDPVEWVHAHLAKPPPPPSQLDAHIPASADAIVLKLLSKHAEDRYHGATGLERDLERCAAALARGDTSAFELGTADVPDDFRVARRLYGREVEVARLIDGFDRARSSGSCVVTLIGGYSGVGKSSLVGELYQPIVRERGRFVAGKFDQYKRDIPYATIVQAFRDLLRGLLAVGEQALARWRHRLGEALGANGGLIVNVIPELELIIGPQPPVLELDPVEGQHRFELVFGAFVRVFARAEHPLVVFLDDMQWADGATLGLLNVLARPGQAPALHLVLAFRSNEVDAAHPFSRAVDAMRARGASIDSVDLLDLEPQHVLQLVADTVSRRPAEATALATVIGAKAGGNPFFIGELLQVLHARGLLTFDAESRGWTWNESAIRAVSVTENVVDLLIDRIRGLPLDTRRMLTLASCFGSLFDLGTLAAVAEMPLASVEEALYPALSEGLVTAANDAVGATRSLRFQHDRIQQAAYSLASEEREASHLRIGRALRARFAAGANDLLFDAVKHLDHGAALVTDVSERQELVELNLLAGRRAKAASAWEPARVYLESAASMLGDDAWTANYSTTFAVLGELAECEFLVGQFATAEARFDQMRRPRQVTRRARGGRELAGEALHRHGSV
ncbi:MAG: serine/threonine-protein kinase PknK [Deltaproteobacteria bacterium]|nr:serine/threonine-protein kinase PknK [Nannocystaceae bacterium]